MDGMFDFLLKAFQIVLINLALSGDNVGVIALAIRNLPPKKARMANLLGVGAASLLRIAFVVVIEWLFTITWLHIDLVGGIVLLLITFNMLREEHEEETGVKERNSMLQAIAVIVAADVSMSLDNVLAIASVAMSPGSVKLTAEELTLIVFGLAICIPIIFFGSSLVSKLMQRFAIIIYLCAGVLVYTAVKMVFDDSLISPFVRQVDERLGLVVAVLCGMMTVGYGFVSVARLKRKGAEGN